MPSTMPRPLNADARTNSPSMSCAALHPGSPAACGASPTCSKHCSPSRSSGVPQQLIGGEEGQPVRVLLIEDDVSIAQSIELMLKSETFNVYTTDLGEEGVDLGKLYDYDIILLDLN